MTAIDGICELVLEAEDLAVLERFYRRLGLEVLAREADRIWMAAGERSRLGIWSPGTKEHGDRGGRHGGDRSIYVTDPEGNRVELRDFFRDGDGARDGVAPLAE